MKQIHRSKILTSGILLMQSIAACAKRHVAEAKVFESGEAVPSSSTEDGKAGLHFSHFIQFTHLEFRSIN